LVLQENSLRFSSDLGISLTTRLMVIDYKYCNEIR